LKKLWPSKVKGVKNFKNPPNAENASSRTPKKILYVVLLSLEFQDDGTPIPLKLIKNKKVMRFESRKGPKKKREKNVFCKLERIFFFLLFSHYSFSFALQR
jgi:hypothetical protein